MVSQWSGFDHDTIHEDLSLSRSKGLQEDSSGKSEIKRLGFHENFSRSLSALIPDSRGLVPSAAEISCCRWASEWKLSPWLGSLGRGLGDPRTTTDSWASPDCNVSEAGPAAAPGRLPAGVINTTTTAENVHHAAVLNSREVL